MELTQDLDIPQLFDCHVPLVLMLCSCVLYTMKCKHLLLMAIWGQLLMCLSGTVLIT